MSQMWPVAVLAPRQGARTLKPMSADLTAAPGTHLFAAQLSRQGRWPNASADGERKP